MRRVPNQLSAFDCEKLLDIVSLLHAPGENRPLRPRLLQSLQALIPHDLGAFHWMQPARHEVVTWFEPQRVRMPAEPAEFWRLFQSHPLHRRLVLQPDRAWKVSDVMPRTDFRRTEVYAALYGPLGVDCELTAVLPAMGGRSPIRAGNKTAEAQRRREDGFFRLSLHRGETDFAERERALLNLLLPHLARAQERLLDENTSERTVFGDEEAFFHWLQDRTGWPVSRREADVLFWLCQGKTNEEIGTILGIAGRTAETHALRVYPKIGVENRFGAIATLNQLASEDGRLFAPARSLAMHSASVALPRRN